MSDQPADSEFRVLACDLQISFYYRLISIRKQYLAAALRPAVRKVELGQLNAELQIYAGGAGLHKLASWGLRGELVYPTPVILQESPFLLGYYRLLYGISQKEFYSKGPFGRFKRLEESGEVSSALLPLIPMLCRSLCQTADRMIDGLDELSPSIIHDLQLLTVGPQLRGIENTRLGDTAVREMYHLINEIVGDWSREQTARSIRIENAAGRTVLIEFSSDPDVLVTELTGSASRTILSIEIKGGGDFSNIHNRLGEAEKSHLKAKRLGCHELWTVIRVAIAADIARRGSPTTTRFFNLDALLSRDTAGFQEFQQALILQLGIR